MPGKRPKHKKSTHILIDTAEDGSRSGYSGLRTGWLLDEDSDYNVNKDPIVKKDTDSAKDSDSRKRVNITGSDTPMKKQVEGKTEEVESRTLEKKEEKKEVKKEVEDVSHTDIEKDIYQITVDGDVNEFLKFMKKRPQFLNQSNAEGYCLIHLAILNNQIAIFKELLKLNADLNIADIEGKTPLHLAIAVESVEMVTVLLGRVVQVAAVDNSGMMPLHAAAEIGSHRIVSILIPTVPNINAKAEGGLTALHIAAVNNHGPVVKLLLENGASPLHKDDHGNYAIHLAAKNASTSAIEALLEGATALGIDKLDLLALRDREKNMPIHCAVISGNIPTVKYFLKSGALITSQQAAGSTPLHLAAAQGLIDMAVIMHERQPDLFNRTINKVDHLKRTPLHWATIFNHVEMLSFLLGKPGIKANVLDNDGNTPLLIAASKGNTQTLSALLKAEADPYCKDRQRRNFLHLLVLSMEIVQGLTEILKDISHYQKLVKSKDIYGFTPLHYAAKCGNLVVFMDLVKLGSPVTLKSNKKQTILHLAAQFGRYRTCVSVLSKPSGASIQNETDEQGLTPLHLAAMCGQMKIVNLLLNKGVSVSKDNKNNTPLHLAALKGRVDCMKIILATHRNLLNLTNSDGNTPLHLAATWGHRDAVVLLLSEGAVFIRNNLNCCFFDDVITRQHHEVALAIIKHARWKEIFQHLSAIHGTFMIGLIKRLPDICLLVLDLCVTTSEHDPSSEEFYVEFNFKYLNLPENFATFAQYNKIYYVPLLPLEEMVRNNRVELLSHPLCVNFLRMKWTKYGVHLNFFRMSMYIIYLAALTLFILSHDPFDHYERPEQKFDWIARIGSDHVTWFGGDNSSNGDIRSLFHESQTVDTVSDTDRVYLWLIISYSFIMLFKSICLLLVMKPEFFSFDLLLELSVNVTAILFALPFVENISTHFQWNCAAICIFLSWFNCLINLQRFDLFGIYVVMFMEILKTLTQVLLIFSVLNIAFGLAFYVLMSHEKSKARESPWLSIYHTFAMFMELDYLTAFNEPLKDDLNITLHFPTVTFLLLAVFILLMPILLTNLLIGLAVGDIESVQREARLKRLATQVKFHSGAESKLPFLRSLTDERMKVYPNKWINIFMIGYRKLVGMGDTFTRDTFAAEADTVVTRELAKTNSKLDQVQTKLDHNIALMKQIIERLHMNVEDEMWDEGDTFVSGIGEIEEVRNKRTKDTKNK